MSSSRKPLITKTRSVRIFLSSTFRDFGEERDLLVKQVFPALRARLKGRFVDLVDVDLRWGITAAQAERGEVLPICLAEIDRARPFFIGLLGDRYGWIPDADAYAPHLVDMYPWLESHRGGKSVTELEILHGVLNNPRMAGRAFFYFRSHAYARRKGGDYLPTSPEDGERQDRLKTRIRRSRFPVVAYRDPRALAKRLERDLWQVLDAAFPATEIPDALERERQVHEAYAAPRRRLYVGGDKYIARLHQFLDAGRQWILIEGQSGGGKSALLANALQEYGRLHKDLVIHEHYLGASSDAADAERLIRRLAETIKRKTDDATAIETDRDKLLESLPLWLAIAHAWAKRKKRRWLIVLDSLNSLSGDRELRWFPQMLPERVQLVVSCLSGDVSDALRAKASWRMIPVKPLTTAGAQNLLEATLARHNKTLPVDLRRRVMRHALSGNPLWIKTVAEELRLFGSHEQLNARLETLLGDPPGKKKGEKPTVDDLFEHVLARVEQDTHARKLAKALTGIWASRSGLSEPELLEFADLAPADWAPMRLALDESLIETRGRFVAGHDYLRLAIKDRYLPQESTQKAAHKNLAHYFAGKEVDERVAEELPYQLLKAEEWRKLKAVLLRHEIFSALYSHRTNEEHLGYWLALEAQAGKLLMERAYRVAWRNWGLAAGTIKNGRIVGDLERFLRASGRYGAFTLKLAQRAQKNAESKLGSEHPQTVTCLNNLALLLLERGDYVAAEPLIRRALAIAGRMRGPKHPQTGSCLNNLAVCLKEKGDYAGAESLYRHALAIAERMRGPEHPQVGTFLSNLAACLEEKGDYAQAESLLRRALAIAERVRGPEHPQVGAFLNNLAGCLEKMGNYAGAEPLYRRALAIAERMGGPEHPHTGSCLNNLAGCLEEKGDYAHAESLLRRALAIAERMRGPEHPHTGRCLENLAGCLEKMGNCAGAEPLYVRALAIMGRQQGKLSEDVLRMSQNYGVLLRGIGRLKEAVEILKLNLSNQIQINGESSERAASAMSALGQTYVEAGKKAAGIDLLNAALSIRMNLEPHGSEKIESLRSRLRAAQ